MTKREVREQLFIWLPVILMAFFCLLAGCGGSEDYDGPSQDCVNAVDQICTCCANPELLKGETDSCDSPEERYIAAGVYERDFGVEDCADLALLSCMQWQEIDGCEPPE